MIGVIDYGLGNVGAFLNIFKGNNISAVAVRETTQLDSVDRIVLPGVGAFDWAMSRLNSSGLREPLNKAVRVDKRPILGVCVGMQMMAESSEEGRTPGLNWIPGEVRLRSRTDGASSALLLPHMGWNDVEPIVDSPLLQGLQSDARFYFLHSYYFVPSGDAITLTKTDYGGWFASAVQKDNAYGVQFHPEKSHGCGIRLLRNFADI